MDESLLAIVEGHMGPVLERFGLTLYDMELVRGRRSSTLRLFIDRPGGVDVEDCARVSEVLSQVLDVEDPIPGAYTLEVSSPGLTRKLKKPRHYRGSVGCKVKLVLRQDVEGQRQVKGTLRAFDGDEGSHVARMEVEGREIAVPLGIIARAELVLDTPEPGTPRR